MLQILGISIVAFLIYLFFKVNSNEPNPKNNNDFFLPDKNHKINLDKFEWMIKDSFDNGLKEHILLLKSEGYNMDTDNPLFAIMLQDWFVNFKEITYKHLPKMGYILGLTQNEINQSIEKIFNRQYSELFVS